MKRIVQIFSYLFLIVNTSIAQTPSNMSYQAVVRDANDKLVANSSIGMQISIIQGSVNGTAVFVETHSVTSNGNGLVTMEIGGGTGVSGDLSGIDWSDGPYFLKTETDPSGGTNYSITGTSELLSVPYAQHASSASSARDDHDKDSLNELQVLSISNDTVFLSDGGMAILPPEIDGSVTNELQALSISNDTVFLSSGGFVVLPPEVDGSVTNELQALSISNDTVFLSSGGFVVLPPEIDGSVTNELQALSISNDTLYIQGGNFVYLGGLRDYDWVENGNHTYNDTDSIGIGTSSPDATLDVNGSFQFTDGNQARGKVLVSDSLGNAMWDSIKIPDTLGSNAGSGITAYWIHGDQAANDITITLDQKSIVTVHSYGIANAENGNGFVGIVFPNESLFHNAGTKVYWLFQGVIVNQLSGWINAASSRTKILEAGTHYIQFGVCSTTNNSTSYCSLLSTSLHVTVIPY